MTVNYVNLQGLKCSAVYRDTETGKTYNGAALMEAGIPDACRDGRIQGVPRCIWWEKNRIQEPVNAGEVADKQFLLHFLQEINAQEDSLEEGTKENRKKRKEK